MGDKEWAEGLAKGTYHNRGTKKRRVAGKREQHHGKTPRVGIHKRRMAARRK